MSYYNQYQHQDFEVVYRQGMDAYQFGLFRSSNPYPYGTQNHIHWGRGWDDAYSAGRNLL